MSPRARDDAVGAMKERRLVEVLEPTEGVDLGEEESEASLPLSVEEAAAAVLLLEELVTRMDCARVKPRAPGLGEAVPEAEAGLAPDDMVLPDGVDRRPLARVVLTS